MGNYARLSVWKKAHHLTLAIYRSTASFPDSERFGLISQLRRAAASVASNIAEGCGRDADRELAYFIRVALGSANEIEYHLLLARDLGILDRVSWQRLHDRTTEIKRMLAAFLQRLRPFQPRDTPIPKADS
jgi:four helix bundle protein